MKPFSKKNKIASYHNAPFHDALEESAGRFRPKNKLEKHGYGTFQPKPKSQNPFLNFEKKNLLSAKTRTQKPFGTTRENAIRKATENLAQAMQEALSEKSHLPSPYDESNLYYNDARDDYIISQGGMIYGDETGTHHCPHIKPFNDNE